VILLMFFAADARWDFNPC